MSGRSIEGKSVLITGAFGGIGSALVEAFLRSGADRVYAASRNPAALNDSRVRVIALDITSPEETERLARQIEIDILVNNAGVNTNTSLLAANQTTKARHEMEVNYFGLLHMCQAFAPQMKARGDGLIVNMLSSASLSPLPRMGSYCASKAAAWSLTQCLRAELEGDGVDVVAIFPGATATRLTAHLTSPKLTPKQVADGTVMAILDGLIDYKMKIGVTHDVQVDQGT